MTEVIAQIVNLFGTASNMIGINIKNKRKVLLFFTFGNLLVAISLLLLRAFVGMYVQLIFVLETIINYFWEQKHQKYPFWLVLMYIFIPSLIFIFTFSSIWDILPILASIFFPLAMVCHDLKLRLLNLLSVVVWIPYNFYFGQYVGSISCLVFTIINLLAIYRYDIKKTKTKKRRNKRE